ncbi:phosphoribosylformylglycinamidine synthase I [Candidatus Peregrinibacteria bacterium]|nr:phosphoribosylformylglycinamidine synthase I [Candidatus Peregrinibacteria bacterium]
MIKFAVISFPGTNCEEENVRVFKRNGMDAETVLWNDPGMLDKTRLDEFDGYCLAGGFSYEDRSRSGIIAAQNPIMDIIKEEAAKGKVVIGICNGAQMVVERGLIPGFNNYDLSAGLAWNEMVKGGEVIDTGFRNSWSYLKNVAPENRSAFNHFEGLLHIPYAHGEGRFVFKDPEVLKALKENNQILFQYCDEKGKVSTEFPITPNGATEAIAGLCNPAGNVLAIMPHPERDPNGNGNQIFQSVKKWIENRSKIDYKSLGEHHTKEDVREFEPVDIEFFVRLIIVDNAERTVEYTLHQKGFDIELKRYAYWAARVKAGMDKKEAALKILQSGELANFNKEWVIVRIEDQFYSYNKEKGLQPVDFKLENFFVACDQKNFVGDSKKQAINLHAGECVEDLGYGVLWEVKKTDDKGLYAIIRTKILYNPNSMYILKN